MYETFTIAMKRLIALAIILTLAFVQGCYLFETAVVEIFPHDKIAKYYMNNLVSAPDRNSEYSRKEQAENDLKQFLQNWNNNMEEIIFDVKIDSVLYKEIKVDHKKLNASVIVRYREFNNFTDTIKSGYYHYKLTGDNIEHNGTEVVIDSTKYAVWPENTEKIVLKFRNISANDIRWNWRRKYIPLGKAYQKGVEKKTLTPPYC